MSEESPKTTFWWWNEWHDLKYPYTFLRCSQKPETYIHRGCGWQLGKSCRASDYSWSWWNNNVNLSREVQKWRVRLELISDDGFRSLRYSTGEQALDGGQIAPNHFTSSLYYPIESGSVVPHQTDITDSDRQKGYSLSLPDGTESTQDDQHQNFSTF